MKGGKEKLITSELSVRKEEKNASKRTAVKKTAKKGKAAEPPTKPKVPGSGFFLFMLDFKKKFKNGEKIDGIAGLEEWKKKPEKEKAPYRFEADKRMAEYEKNLEEYKKNLEAYEKSMEDEHDD